MPLRRLASVALLLGLVPACSAIVQPDTNRLGGGPDTGLGGHDGGGTIDTGLPPIDTGMPPIDTGVPPDDGGMQCSASCDDTIACTADSCDTASGTCRHAPNDGACGAGMRCNPTMGCITNACINDVQCADGDVCDGIERCAPGAPGADPTTGCVHGTPITSCDDGISCTTDSCSAAIGCVHMPVDAACDDGFACTTDACVSGDGCHHEANDALCDTGCISGGSCQIGAGCVGGTPMTCPSDGNGCTSDPTMCDLATGTCLHPPRDDDGDGHPTAMANGMTCPGGDDCNDQDMTVHPGATELCDGRDNDCNGAIDDGAACLPPGPDSCATEGQIVLSGGTGGMRGGMASGSNVMLGDSLTTSCGHTGGRDAVYYVDIPAGSFTNAVDVVISTDSPTTTYDTVLAATVGGTCGFGSARCNDDISGTNQRSRLAICIPATTLGAPTRVHILVDAFDGTQTGNYNVTVTVTPRATPVCG